jgi:2-polyprenyl-6-methoxyphenol hydroxylase-like FAD-dependent oxidoreductase
VTASVHVVGAGPAGAAAAIAAAARGEPVVWYGQPVCWPTGSLEVLSWYGVQALDRLGLAAEMRRHAVPCHGTVLRWGADGFQEWPSLLAPGGGGLIVDRARLDPLLASVAARAGVRREPFRRHAAPGRRVVVATGRSGAGLSRWGLSRLPGRRLVALLARLDRPIPDLGQRLLLDQGRDGWWYAIGDGTATTLGYCTTAGQLPIGAGRVAAAWAAACRGASDWLPDAARRAPVRVRPAGAGRVDRPWPEGITPIGDAALALDPLSGQGLAFALHSGVRALDDDYARWLCGVADEHAAHEASLWSRTGS